MSNLVNNHIHHVFYIHSGITHNMAIGFIKYRDLKSHQVYFITNRSYQHPEIPGSKTIDISDILIDINKPTPLILEKMDQLKEILIKLLAKPFLLYAPSTSILEIQTILNNRHCQGFYIIEEGNLAYNKTIYLTGRPLGISSVAWQLWKLKCYFKSRGKLLGLPYVAIDHSKFKGVIGIDKESFKDINPAIRIGSPFRVKKDIPDMHIIAFSNAINQNAINMASFISGFHKIIEHIRIDTEIIYYKWHPGFKRSLSLVDQLQNVFLSYPELQFNELTDENSLEEIAVSSDSTFYSDYSSILIYASNAGCKVFSNSKYLTGTWDTSAIWKRYHSGILDKIKFL